MTHTVIRDNTLNGWEYGMLRSFENAIVNKTDAIICEIPEYEYGVKYLHHFGHGMSKGKYRKYFPLQKLKDETADVGWYILMGPESYRLDLYKGWKDDFKIKILYIFDTLPSQYPLIKKLLSNNDWDILITSFNDAVCDLERITGRKWYCIEQAADSALFQPVGFNERLIHFSSYGRRYPIVHDVIGEFCKSNKLYYDYTTHDAKHPVANPVDLYKQYAWHLSHSLFTFSWPVELTNPVRAGHLNPITCRWFEASATGTIILGTPPNNGLFNKYFPYNHVLTVDPFSTKENMFKLIESLWDKREALSLKAISASKELEDKNNWENRVDKALSLIM